MKKTEMPSLMFKINEQNYAVDTALVSTIFQIQGPVTPMPDYPDFVKGVYRLRNEIIPIIEMRRILRMPSVQEEYDKFVAMLDQRKNDHIRWVDELKRSVNEKTSFTLATDPHKCALGRWLDGFETQNQALKFHLNKIMQPHALLHQTAVDAIACDQQHEACARNECLKASLDKATNVYVPQVLELLEHAKEIFKDHYREMCIVLSKNDTLIGLLVDEVLSVEDVMDEGHWQEGGFVRDKGRLVEGVVHSGQVDGEILVLNEQQLFDDFINAREAIAG